jgi:hypothetical protein
VNPRVFLKMRNLAAFNAGACGFWVFDVWLAVKLQFAAGDAPALQH